RTTRQAGRGVTGSRENVTQTVPRYLSVNQALTRKAVYLFENKREQIGPRACQKKRIKHCPL
ncbi:hypothetical protein AD928_01790, partial [Acetobacter cerevisiae]